MQIYNIDFELIKRLVVGFARGLGPDEFLIRSFGETIRINHRKYVKALIAKKKVSKVGMIKKIFHKLAYFKLNYL